MKTRYFKKIFASALMVTAILGTSSCINDLDISPIDPQYAPSFDQNDVFVKEYALLGLTGQKGPAGSEPISTDKMKVNQDFTVPSLTATNYQVMNVSGLGKPTQISLS